MANFIELSDYWAVEESADGRFLTNRKTKQRVVDLGEEDIEITYIDFSWKEPVDEFMFTFESDYSYLFHTFKVKTKHGTGLIQFEGLPYNPQNELDKMLYNSFSCSDLHEMLEFKDVLTVPTEYDDVFINYNSEKNRMYFPIACKNEKYDIFYKGNKLENASGAEAIDMRNSPTQILSHKEYQTYIISETDEILFSFERKQFPEFCFIQDASSKNSVYTTKIGCGKCSGYSEKARNYIGMYDSRGKVGIMYIDDNKEIHNYITDIPFGSKNNLYLINENYLIYHHDDANYLYFKGSCVGKLIANSSIKTNCNILLPTDIGIFLGRNFHKIGSYLLWSKLNLCKVEADEYDTEITLICSVLGDYDDSSNFKFEIVELTPTEYENETGIILRGMDISDERYFRFTFKYNSKTDTEVQ